MFISKKKLEAMINQETEKRLHEYDEKRWQDDRFRELDRKVYNLEMELGKHIHAQEACITMNGVSEAKSVLL